MIFIYILQLSSPYKHARRWNEQAHQIIEEHFNYLTLLHKKGEVLQFGRTDYPTDNADLFGLVVLQAATEDAALELMLDDPAVREGVMTAKLMPYKKII